jgi:hypothetical protein
MKTPNAYDVYRLHVRTLSVAERRRLLALVAEDLAGGSSGDGKKHSIMELRGLGAELWAGVDPDKYVESLRSEWDAEG